ncbi:Abi family protein [Ursidibacter maritimus]|uniref:Abi family protein n=1 Tax=Ursidibacter maritimus TaxID=1331689 RepID=UPI001C460992|nr:Abi family protein [Ursidibacter maritimus]MBV6540715.1 Abi family protein [Ursidibacter maritimus]
MTLTNITDIQPFISQERALTFINQYQKCNPENTVDQEYSMQKAYQLYMWNIQMSGALLEVLAWYEVVLRNSIMKVISYKFYPYGIFNNRFILSLNDTTAQIFIDAVNSVHPTEKYILKWDEKGRMSAPNIQNASEGRVIAELGFGFWENLLSKKYNKGMWEPHFRRAFPNMTNSSDVEIVYSITQDIRKIRNRVCHHEPIFKLNGNNILANIEKVLNYIDPVLVDTMMKIERISSLEIERINKAL